MAKIAFIIENGFEDSEFQDVYDALMNAGHNCETISLDREEKVSKKKLLRVTADKIIDEVFPDDYGALIIPGGTSPEILRRDGRVLDFVQDFAKMERPIGAICHGPEVLISAGLVEGKKMTSHPSVQDELKESGAYVIDDAPIIDGVFITARSPSDNDRFIETLLYRINDNEENNENT